MKKEKAAHFFFLIFHIFTFNGSRRRPGFLRQARS